jgi:hypothetical protein
MDSNHQISLPLYREYNLTDPRDRRSFYAALRSRASIKSRIRNQMASANYPYPWEQEQDNV